MNYSEFYDDILIDCSRATTAVALAAVRKAVIELCSRSRIWHYTSEAESSLANVREYELDLPADSELIEVLGGYFNGIEIFSKSHDELDRLFGQWQTLTGDPSFITTEIPGTVLVVPYPTTTTSNALKWRLALRPTRDSTSFDEDNIFATEFYDDILHGAKARLMMSPSKPYSNLKLAEFHEKKFQAGINRARIRANKSQSRTETHVEFPRYI